MPASRSSLARTPLLLLAAASLSIALTQPAAAVEEANFDFETTKDLYAVCSTTTEDAGGAVARVACRAFIEATVQYHDAVSDRKDLKRLICYPQGTSVADGRTAFISWAEKNANNAKRMGELPVIGLVRALAAAYPCK
jgi:hypothetical protein